MRLFGHVMKRYDLSAVRIIMEISVYDKSGKEDNRRGGIESDKKTTSVDERKVKDL